MGFLLGKCGGYRDHEGIGFALKTALVKPLLMCALFDSEHKSMEAIGNIGKRVCFGSYAPDSFNSGPYTGAQQGRIHWHGFLLRKCGKLKMKSN